MPKYPTRMTVLGRPGFVMLSDENVGPRMASIDPHSIHLSCDGVGTSMQHSIRNLSSALHDMGMEVSASIGGPLDDDRWEIGEKGRSSPWISIRWNTDIEDRESPWASLKVIIDVADSWSWTMRERVEKMNSSYDMLLVPSRSNVSEFKRAGVTIPIVVVPFGVDTTVYHPVDEDWSIVESAQWNRIPEPGTFLFIVAGQLCPKKGVDVALEAFDLAFQPEDRVALLVKNSLRGNGISQRNTVAMKAGHGMVGLIEEHLEDDAMCRLLSTADCLVSCHHREGFGFMPLQAMACGTIPIVTAWDGPLSYANNHNSILVPPTRVIKTKSILGYENGLDWAEIDPSDVARAMRQAYHGDTSEMRTGAIETAEKWSWRASAESLVTAIENNLNVSIRRSTN